TPAGVRSSSRAVATDAGCDPSSIAAVVRRRPVGSNAWAAGAARTIGSRALIANDPHLDLTIPGIWYLLDLQSPGVHAAGATIPGLPGVVLGHNDSIAWATTNADMTTTSLFAAGRLDPARWVTERFGVRFGREVLVRYYRTPREFSVPNESDASKITLVRWPVYAERRSTIETALALDRARDARDALRILARYHGSPQNFIVADRSGAVAYHVAGLVPDDPAWGRYVHPASDLGAIFAAIPFARLPARSASRAAVVLSANNKPYGAAYPYRLSAQFEPPYRAYRIAQLLYARSGFDLAYFERMQLDTLSPIDLEIARDLGMHNWDGRFTADSRAASVEHTLRLALFGDGAPSAQMNALRAGRRDVDSYAIAGLSGAQPWGETGGMRIEHVLAPLNFPFLDGGWLPGAGDEYTIHLQEPKIAQGFRAVWVAGDWDRGGIAIPSGESGEPGSGHYTDLTRDWIAGILRPLPFSRAAVDASAAAVLTLRPN
ncbi:MAG TPA: penicillin acylase family protein, partial [Candidatus Nitrosotalea sp.]|nr:penicillin acylase family protein [Candidatus Nitrosotalea sp.]